MELRLSKEELDPAAVAYAALTDEQAREQVKKVRLRIAEIKGIAEIGKNPQVIMELRSLYAALEWYNHNKNRSKHFNIVSSGPSMRRANRHPNTSNTLVERELNENRSVKCSLSKGQKRKKVQIPRASVSSVHQECKPAE
jgi:hypothetical protein